MKKIVFLLAFLMLFTTSIDAQRKKRSSQRTTTARTTTTPAKSTAVYGWAAKWKDKAEAGDAEAQYELAFCYYWPIDVEEDYAKAMEWAKKSSEQGYSLATELVGRIYLDGDGVTKNEDEANRWAKLAYQQAKPLAEAGDAHAQYTLYLLYNNGRGVVANKDEARKWLEKSAAQGYHWAQNSFGYELEQRNDLIKAVIYFRMAAKQGNPIAQCNTGYMYDYGKGVTQNPSEATEWYRLAADNGYEKAKRILGLTSDSNDDSYSSTMRNLAGTWRCNDSSLQLKFDSNGNGWARAKDKRGQWTRWNAVGVKYLSYNEVRVYGEGWTHVLHISGNRMKFGYSSSYDYYKTQ